MLHSRSRLQGPPVAFMSTTYNSPPEASIYYIAVLRAIMQSLTALHNRVVVVVGHRVHWIKYYRVRVRMGTILNSTMVILM